MALIRLVIIGGIVLTVIYFCVSFYSRAVRAGKLWEAWEAGDRDGDWDVGPEDASGPHQNWEAYREAGMAQYDRSLKKKLIWGVYVVPVALVSLVIYITNYT